MHGIRVWRYLQCANICRFKRAQCHSAPFLQLWNLITDSCLTLWILMVSCHSHSCLQFLISVVSSTHFWVRCQAACLEAREALEDARQREKAGSVQNGWLWHIRVCRSSWMPRMGGGWCKIWIFNGHRKGGCCPCFQAAKRNEDSS